MSTKVSFNEFRRKGVIVLPEEGTGGNVFPRRASAPDAISEYAQGWYDTVAGAPKLTLAIEDGGGTLQFVMTNPE